MGGSHVSDYRSTPGDTGYGHGPDESAKVVADGALLLGYFEDVHERSLVFVRSLDETESGAGGG